MTGFGKTWEARLFKGHVEARVGTFWIGADVLQRTHEGQR